MEGSTRPFGSSLSSDLGVDRGERDGWRLGAGVWRGYLLPAGAGAGTATVSTTDIAQHIPCRAQSLHLEESFGTN